MFFLKKILKKFIPHKLSLTLSWVRNNLQYLIFQQNYKVVLNRLKKKKQISVAFFVFNIDTWKANSVYRAFEESKKYNPVIVICPFVTKGDDFLQQQFEQVLNFVKKNNYKFILGFEGMTEKAVKKAKLPGFDIIFYLNPNPLSIPSFSVFNNNESLNFYLPYSFNIDNLFDYEYNNQFINVMFGVFTMTKYHQNLYKKFSDVNGLNTQVVGFPHLDGYFSKPETMPWKNKKSTRKKIIWGPHWTIPGMQETGLDWSCFIEYSDLFLAMADNYSEQIELALKPHPFLFQMLGKEENWGNEKLNSYLEEWNNRENCQIHLGDYTDLFLTSDALIHDSGSFSVEYLCIYKPLAYTNNSIDLMSRFNEIGQKVISVHRLLKDSKDIDQFIQDVIAGVDVFSVERRDFLKNEIYADGKTGERIVEHINKILD